MSLISVFLRIVIEAADCMKHRFEAADYTKHRFEGVDCVKHT